MPTVAPPAPPPDAALLARFVADRDEFAFAELVRRHGPTVLGVCRRILADGHDADDAFQAVFVVLARRAGAIDPPEAVAGWLYGVAVKTATRARAMHAKRRRKEREATAHRPPAAPPSPQTDLRAVLDAELARLPAAYRSAVVRCDLGGQTRKAAARDLGVPEGTLATRLAKARELLAQRLLRRGVTPAAVAAVSVPAALTTATVATATGSAPLPPAVSLLAEAVMTALSRTTWKLTAALVCVAGVLTTAVAAWPGDGPKPADPARPRAKALASPWVQSPDLKFTGWLPGSVTFGPDGKTLAVGGTGGNAHLIDLTTRQSVWEYRKRSGPFAAVAVHPDGKTVAVTTADGVRLMDAATGKFGRLLASDSGQSTAVALFPDREPKRPGDAPVTTRRVAAAGPAGTTVWQWLGDAAAAGTIQLESKSADPYAVPLAVRPDGNRVLLNGPTDPATGKAFVWVRSTVPGEPHEPFETFQVHPGDMVCATWAGDGSLLVTGDAAGWVMGWDGATLKAKWRHHLGGRVCAVAVSGDGKRFAAAGVSTGLPLRAGATEIYTEDVYAWDAGEEPKSLLRAEGGTTFAGPAGVAFGPDGTTLAAAFANVKQGANGGRLVGTVRLWQRPPAKTAEKQSNAVRDRTRSTVNVPVKAPVPPREGKILMWVGDKPQLLKPDGTELASPDPIANTRLGVPWDRARLSPDGTRLAFVREGEPLNVAPPKELPAGAVFSNRRHTIHVLDLDGKNPAKAFDSFVAAHFDWLGDGSKLYVYGSEIGDGDVLREKAGPAVYDTASGKLTPLKLPDQFHVLAFAPDGTTALLEEIKTTADTWHRRVHLWTVGSDAKPTPILDLNHGAGSPRFSPDGKRLLAHVSHTATITAQGNGVWMMGEPTVSRRVVIDLATTKQTLLKDFLREKSEWEARGLAWSPDGKRVAYLDTKRLPQVPGGRNGSEFRLMVADADGTNEKEVYRTAGSWLVGFDWQ